MSCGPSQEFGDRCGGYGDGENMWRVESGELANHWRSMYRILLLDSLGVAWEGPVGQGGRGLLVEASRLRVVQKGVARLGWVT